MKKKSNLGINRTLFIYSSKHLSGSKKVRFFYALKGRGKNAGLIDGKSVIQLSKKTLFVSSRKKDEVRSFLNYWNCEYTALSQNQLTKYTLLKYDSSSFSSTELVKFYYALKGRGDSAGILKSTNSTQLSKGLVLVPNSKIKQIRQFFEFWNCKIEEVSLENEQ